MISSYVFHAAFLLRADACFFFLTDPLHLNTLSLIAKKLFKYKTRWFSLDNFYRWH